MRRPWHIWIGFALCLVVALAAMSFITLTALRLDLAETAARHQEAEARRQEALARRRAAWEESVRLALWRIDSMLAPFISQEHVRPYFAYSAFLPIDRAYSAMFNDRGGGEMLIPSPLLSERAPNVLVHFQFEPDGRLTSPQVPVGANYKLAVPNHVGSDAIRRAEEQLRRVEALVDRQRLLAMLPASAPGPVEMVVSPLGQTAEQRLTQQKQRQADLQQRGRGVVEFNERNFAVQQQANVIARNQDFIQFNTLQMPSTDVSGVLMTPLWIDGSLILARRVTAGGREYVQGCLLDWQGIKASLLDTVEDLLPEADVEPVTSAPAEEEGRMLAALPARLIPGEPIFLEQVGRESAAAGLLSPIRLSLGVAWVCTLLAAAAVAAVLRGVMRLAERRASFVTAVTHELRTPLTTFQMYAEMLAEGMVPDEQQQKQYLTTLRAEAVRLTHMVENVLSYARLERGRADGRLESVAVDRLIEPIKDRLAGRAEQAGMTLAVQSDDGAGETVVRANASAVEQVLFNLVDNACKYANSASDRRIHLLLSANGNTVEVSLRDHGPGISPSVRRRLFRSFSKSAHEAAHTAPGIGLGLALSRRLARDMGGDLRIDETVSDGARFVLTLAGISV